MNKITPDNDQPIIIDQSKDNILEIEDDNIIDVKEVKEADGSLAFSTVGEDFEPFQAGPTEPQIDLPEEVLSFVADKTDEFNLEEIFGKEATEIEEVIPEVEVPYQGAVEDGFAEAEQSIQPIIEAFAAKVAERITEETPTVTLTMEDFLEPFASAATLTATVVYQPIAKQFLETFLEQRSIFQTLTETHATLLEARKAEYERVLQAENEALPNNLRNALLLNRLRVQQAKDNYSETEQEINFEISRNNEEARQEISKIEHNLSTAKAAEKTRTDALLTETRSKSDNAKQKPSK